MTDDKKKVAYAEGKTYLKGPDGLVHPYDANLAKVAGWSTVVPNPVKATEAKKADTATTETKKTS